MSKHIRKLVPLLLCLLLMACLLPAAYAEAAAVSTLEELQAALNNHTSNIMFANDMIVPETDITVPSGVTLTVRGVTFWANNIEVQPGGSIIADSGNMSTMNRLTVNGSLTVNDAVVITDGSSWDNLKNASITYGNAESKISFHFPTFNVQEARAAIAKAAEITSQRVDPLVFINYAAEISDNYVIPEGVKVEHTGLTVTTNGTLTVNGTLRTMLDGILTVNGNLINNGTLNVWDNGTINMPGNLSNNGKIDLSTSGVLRIGGIFTGNPGSRIDVPDADLTDPENIQPRVIREDGGEFNNMSGIVFSKSVLDSGVDCSAFIQNIDMNDYCRHVGHQRSEIHYYPGSVLNFEGMFPVGGKYIENLEVHGLDTLTLSDNVEVPVLDDGTVSKVDMHATKLVVPDGKSVLVNGVLAAKELVIESGGSVTVNGYLDAVNGITLNNDGALTVNNTQIDAGYVPTTDIEALKNIVYNGDASMQLHLVVWPSDDVPNAITTASAVVDDHVSCMVELRTGWTVTDATDCHLITLKVRKDGTLTVNNELIVKDLIVDDGGTVIKGPNGSITYAADSGIEALREAIANPAISEFELRGSPVTLTEALTVPSDFTVKVGSGSSLVIPAGVDVNLEGRLVLRDGAALELAGSMREGTLELDEGATVNLTGMCRLEPDKLRLDGEIAATGGGMSEPKLMALNNGRPNGRITVTAGSRPSVRIDGLDETKLSEWVKFNDNEGYFVLYYHAESDAEFSATMEDMKALPARFYGIQELDYAAVVRGNVVFPGIEIRVAGYDGASLTIAEGAVLTAPTVMLQGAQMTVNGTFISISRDEPYNNHNGALILTQNDGLDAMLTVTDTGIVGGTDCSIELPQGTTDPTRYVSGINPGQLKVVPDPYRPFKIYAVAPELHLPESLNAIESEAFAGGSFSSVYIPAGVSSIDSDAFGDMTGLKVYGEYGTEAATFASNHHFPFAPLAWRGNQ